MTMTAYDSVQQGREDFQNRNLHTEINDQNTAHTFISIFSSQSNKGHHQLLDWVQFCDLKGMT